MQHLIHKMTYVNRKPFVLYINSIALASSQLDLQVEPNMVSYGTAINALVQGSQWHLALKLLAAAQNQGVGVSQALAQGFLNRQ